MPTPSIPAPSNPCRPPSRARISSHPTSPAAADQLRGRRRYLADLWLGMNYDTLRVAYNSPLAEAQRLCTLGPALAGRRHPMKRPTRPGCSRP